MPGPRSKPELRPWVPPAETKEPVEYADLFTIDLSLYDSPNPEDKKKLLEDFSESCSCLNLIYKSHLALLYSTGTAIFRDGFLYLVNFGLTQEQIAQQFAISQNALIDGNITPEEMRR